MIVVVDMDRLSSIFDACDDAMAVSYVCSCAFLGHLQRVWYRYVSDLWHATGLVVFTTRRLRRARLSTSCERAGFSCFSYELGVDVLPNLVCCETRVLGVSVSVWTTSTQTRGVTK